MFHFEMSETLRIVLDLAIILFATKAVGMLLRKLGIPQVVGMVIAGLLIGPAIWSLCGWQGLVPYAPGAERDFLNGIGEIGVIMILFSAGLETDVKELKKCGLFASLIAFGGVLVPLAGGFLIAVPFLGGFKALADKAVLIDALFIGVILTATSVGITVETLKEMGRLKGKIGTVTLSAAIIDDVIGIVVLSVALGLNDPSINPWFTIIKTVLFFIAAIAVGLLLNRLFKWLMKKYPHHRRIGIWGLVVCFLFAFCADYVFGVADITGAYIAGIMLAPLKESTYIDRKISINTYMLFAPVFFADIGLKTEFNDMNGTVLLFALAFVAVGILGKILGAGGVAKACRFSTRESAQVGVGMIARGEVALVVCSKAFGEADGTFRTLTGTNINPIVAVILLVIVSSVLAPILLKLAFKGAPAPPAAPSDPPKKRDIADELSVGLVEDDIKPNLSEAHASPSAAPAAGADHGGGGK